MQENVVILAPRDESVRLLGKLFKQDTVRTTARASVSHGAFARERWIAVSWLSSSLFTRDHSSRGARVTTLREAEPRTQRVPRQSQRTTKISIQHGPVEFATRPGSTGEVMS